MSKNTHQKFGYAPTGGAGYSGRKSTPQSSEMEKLSRILINDPTKPAIRRSSEPQGGQMDYVKRVSDSNLQSAIDAENIQELLPDVVKAKQILVSTILSPKDLITVNPNYTCDSEHLGEVAIEMIRIVEEDLDRNYKIKTKMKKHLEDMLFDYGSHISVIIPKSRIDSIINSDRGFSNEAYEQVRNNTLIPQSIGVLGDPDFSMGRQSGRSWSVEQAFNAPVKSYVGHKDFCLNVTDNPDAFKLGEITKRWQEQRIAEAYEINRTFSLEDRGLHIDTSRKVEKKKAEANGSPFKNRWYNRKLVLDIEENSKVDESYDYDETPLLYDIPPEAFIPVHAPSDPSNVIGGFILTDPTTGSPIRKSSVHDFYQSLQQGASPTAGANSQMLGRMRSTLMDYGYNSGGGAETDADTMLRIYTGIVEDDVKRRLKNGVNADNAEITRNDEVYRIMFARSCAQQQTQLIYIPKRFMTYFAFDYDERGVGISLLTKSKTMAAIRATVAMANFFSTIRNSTNYRKFTLELDENDPDPDETVETTIHEISRSTQQNMPMFEPNPTDIVNFLQNAGISVEVSGHPRWASTKVDIQNQQASNVTIDTDFVDRLQMDHMGFLGVPAEAVNSSLDMEFMRNIIQNHLLFSKGAMRYQDEYTPQLTDDVRKYITANGRLLNKLKAVVKERRDILKGLGVMDTNSENDIVNHFVNNFNVSLPAPDLTKIDVQMEEFDKYNEALEKFLPSFISSDILGNDTAMQLGELGGNIDNLVNITRAFLQRKWLAEHGVMPELFDLIAETSEDTPAAEVVDQHLIHHGALVKLLVPLISKLTKRNNQVAEIINKLGESDDSESESDNGSGDTSGDGDNGYDDGTGDGETGDPDQTDGGFDDFDTGDGDLGGFDGGDGGEGETSEPASDDPTKDETSAGTDDETSDAEPEVKEKEDDDNSDAEEKVDDSKEEKDAEKEADDDLGGFKG